MTMPRLFLLVLATTTLAVGKKCRTENTITKNPDCADESCGWGGNSNYLKAMNKPCLFPFVYKGVTYDSCTSEDHWMPWCPTHLADGAVVVGSGNWGNCAASCFQANSGGDANPYLSFPCSKVPTCCTADFGEADLYTPPVTTQAAHIVGVAAEEYRDDVMQDVFSLDGRNRLNPNVQRFSSLKTMFLADLNPVEVGFLLNDTDRVTFVECNGIVTTQTKKQKGSKQNSGQSDADVSFAQLVPTDAGAGVSSQASAEGDPRGGPRNRRKLRRNLRQVATDTLLRTNR